MNYYDLSIGVIDPYVCNAPRGSVEHRHRRFGAYGDASGDPELRQLIAQSLGLDITRVGITNGASTAISATMATLRNKGPILLPRPCFPGYIKIARALGLEVVFYDLPIDRDPYDTILHKLRQNPRAGTIFINNPGNPLGTVTSADRIEYLCTLAISANITPVVDETYLGLRFDGPKLEDKLAQGFTGIRIRSLSKAPRWASLRLGYISAEPTLLTEIMQTHWGMNLGVSQASQEIAIESLRSMDDWTLEEDRHHLTRARDLSLKILDGSGVQTSYPLASPVLWIELPHCELSSLQIAEKLKERCNIIVEPGLHFGVKGRTAFRCCFGLPIEKIEILFPAIASECENSITTKTSGALTGDRRRTSKV